MSDEQRPKRHLTLMPEVLPRPTQLPSTEGTPVRETRTRTLDHMRKLLASAAATSAVLAGCGPEAADKPSGTASQKPTTSASATASASSSAATSADPSASASSSPPPSASTASASASSASSTSPTASAKPTLTPRHPPTGYMVVDPVPPPPPKKAP